MAPSALHCAVALILVGSSSASHVDDIVSRLNADPNDHATYTADGPFARIPQEEFARTRLLSPRSAPDSDSYESHRVHEKFTDTPDSFDWRDQNVVSAVKNQGSLGTCWAFSTAGTLEGQLAIKHAKLTNLSVEQLVECDNSNADNAADCGMFGGWPYLAFDYLKDAGGMYDDSDWPYCAYTTRKSDITQCWPCMADDYSVDYCGWHGDMYCNASGTKGQGAQQLCKSADGAVVQVDSWMVEILHSTGLYHHKWSSQAISNDEAEIASSLVKYGPLSVLLNAATLQWYKSGIYSPSHCDPDSLDHAVLLVGYGTDDGVDYWTVKNSWGDSWGEDGYFRILRGEGTCGINTGVTAAQVV